jgi:hypothetical protein
MTSPTKLTVTDPQLSDAVTRVVLTGGTAEAHATVTGAGHVIVGA